MRNDSLFDFRQKYNLSEFNGYRLIEKLHYYEKDTVVFRTLDFSTRVKKNLSGVIETTETHLYNAMFYQLEKCLEEMESTDDTAELKAKLDTWNSDSLKDILIYIDFSDIFPLEKYARKKFNRDGNTPEDIRQEDIGICEEIVEKFFAQGFAILYHEDRPSVKYVPFEKSASMARAGSMIFIDQRLYQPMEKRLRLGLDFCGTPISASKLYAYTSLYLSNAKRIDENPAFILNEETVIVLEDKTHSGTIPVRVISGEDAGESEDAAGLQKWDIREFESEERASEFTINYFDGEGLISPKYADYINDVLHRQYGMSGTATSFQIRMPFVKGMLHQVDFHSFFCETLEIPSCSNVFIKDAFGKQRSLEKVQIILTQSMLKMFKWIMNPKISGIKEKENCMTLYFDRFRRYDHAFHVGVTDMNMARTGKARLSHQFLNTLALSEEELKEIVQEHAGFVSSEGSDRNLITELAGSTLQDEDDDTSFDNHVDAGETWITVAKYNTAFLKDPKVKGMLKGVRYSLLKDIGRGRLAVSGTTRFLSGDLLVFLAWMIKKSDALSETERENLYNSLKGSGLRSTKFFVADCVPGTELFRHAKKLRLDSKQYYGLLRSPHLSRNEQCSLRPYIPHEEDIYSRYFGHLKGILMVPGNSYVPQALGGADFDGDLVNIITDERVNRAINDACYKPDVKESEKKHERLLPIVMIPNTDPKTILLKPDRVDFNTLRDTFSSKVGKISNRAIFFGKRQYYKTPPDPEYAMKCETCTILVGLEIDAAKTGRHPDLEGILGDKDGKDYFVERKEEIDRLPKWQSGFNVEDIPESKSKKATHLHRHRLAAKLNYGPNKGDEVMSAVFPGDYEDNCENKYYLIDYLPFWCLEQLDNSDDSGKRDNDVKEEAGPRFLFETRSDWKKEVSDSEKEEIVRDLIYAYKSIHATAKDVNRIKGQLKNSNYIGNIKTILKIQNKGLIDAAETEELQQQIFNQLLERMDSYDAASRALDQLLNDNVWQYCESETEKLKYLNEKLFGYYGTNLAGNVSKALCNFRWNGYYLLYYYIKDIISYHLKRDWEQQIEQGEKEQKTPKRTGKHYTEYHETFRKIYERALDNKESQKIWGNRIAKECRRILKDTFGDRVDEALLYTHSLRNIDRYGSFFWDVFTANEILHKSEVKSDLSYQPGETACFDEWIL